MPNEESRDVSFDLKERAMDEAPVGITISNPDREDNPLVYVNDAFERLTGYSREAVMGRNCRFLQGERTDTEAVAELRAAIDPAEPVSVELVNYRRDGEPFWWWRLLGIGRRVRRFATEADLGRKGRWVDIGRGVIDRGRGIV